MGDIPSATLKPRTKYFQPTTSPINIILSAARSRLLTGISSIFSPKIRLRMGPLQPRTTSVSVTTFVATTVVLVLWILAVVAVAICLLIRLRNRPQRTSSLNRSASYGNRAPLFPPSDPTALPSYPHRAHAPFYPPNGPPSLSASTRPTEFGPIRTASPNIDPVPHRPSTRIEDCGRMTTLSPTRNPVPAASSTNEATQPLLLANNPAHVAMLARLQAMPLASDTTDMSTDTVDPGREVANPGYLAMLGQRGIPARDHALLGSDDSTDAGGGAGAALSYATRARGMSPMGVRMDTELNPSRFTRQGGRGRAVTLERENGEEGLGRVWPLRVRKMASM